MVGEYCLLMKNDTCDLFSQLQGNNVVKCQWICKASLNFKGIVDVHVSPLEASSRHLQ